MKTYDVVWKRDETEGKARWEKVGVLLEKDNGKMSIKLDLIPASGWDGWLVVAERQAERQQRPPADEDVPF